MAQALPIIIHSLFRAGSTYIFNRFRRSSHGYWCYQEPLNEFLLNAVHDPKKLLELHEDNTQHLRHPQLDRPYFYEFYPLAAEIAATFRPEFPYEDYFSNTESTTDALGRYLRVLVNGAQGHPVLQECRSCGRVEAIRQAIGGLHIFLWRNPWDQWWSYKVDSHFEVCNLQILAGLSVPPVFVELRTQLGFNPEYSDVSSLVGYRLDAAGSYVLFFALWCHAMLEARSVCDLEINIDSLSQHAEYRSMIEQQLGAHGIDDLDFSDCAIPNSTYGSDDRQFFRQLEERVIGLFLSHGYSEADLDAILSARAAHDVHNSGQQTPIHGLAAEEFDRVRSTARRFESELAGAQRALGQQQRYSAQLNAERQQLEATLGMQEVERQQLEATLGMKEGERQQLEAALGMKEQALNQVLSSISWRVGAPARALARITLKFIRTLLGEHR